MIEVDVAPETEFAADQPIKGVFFSVFVSYNLEHPSVRRKVEPGKAFIESNPLPTFRSANECSSVMAEQIRKSYRGSEIHQIPHDEAPDVFTLFVIDKKKRAIAKLGVVAEDYRGRTIH